MEWCTIESDPAVFSELLEKIGVANVGVEEVYDLDDRAYLESLGRIYGFIFLFRFTKQTEPRACLTQFDSDLFYAKQVITNACGTQALLSVVLNVPELQLGQELAGFKDFCQHIGPEDRGIALGDLDIVRTNHNSFARPEQFSVQATRKAKDGDDVFHFVAYVPFKKQVYELDGIQKGPILLGEETNEKSWIDIAAEEINKRIRQYADLFDPQVPREGDPFHTFGCEQEQGTHHQRANRSPPETQR